MEKIILNNLWKRLGGTNVGWILPNALSIVMMNSHYAPNHIHGIVEIRNITMVKNTTLRLGYHRRERFFEPFPTCTDYRNSPRFKDIFVAQDQRDKKPISISNGKNLFMIIL